MNIDAVAEAIVASMEEQCDFRHVGLIGAHVNWKSVAQAAIDALQLTDEWCNAYERQWGEDGTWHEDRTGASTDRGVAEMNMRLDAAHPADWSRNMRIESRWVSPWVEEQS